MRRAIASGEVSSSEPWKPAPALATTMSRLSEGRERLVDRPRHVVVRGDVAGHDVGPAAGRPDAPGDVLQPIAPPCQQRDRAALRAECHGRRRPDARRRAADQRDAVCPAPHPGPQLAIAHGNRPRYSGYAIPRPRVPGGSRRRSSRCCRSSLRNGPLRRPGRSPVRRRPSRACATSNSSRSAARTPRPISRRTASSSIFQSTRDGAACDQQFVMNVDGSGVRRVSSGAGPHHLRLLHARRRRASSTPARTAAAPPARRGRPTSAATSGRSTTATTSTRPTPTAAASRRSRRRRATTPRRRSRRTAASSSPASATATWRSIR